MKKFTASFLIFSLMMLSVNLYAKKRGVNLIITKIDGTKFQGELITVKQNSLLMFASKRKDVSVDIKVKDIEKIVIVKKSTLWIGLWTGGLIGGYAGGSIGSKVPTEDPYGPIAYWYLGALIGSAIGVLIGVLIAKAVAPFEVILIEGMTDSEIQETLDKLRKKARVRNYK